jgi:mRNA interferase RelE/StbE
LSAEFRIFETEQFQRDLKRLGRGGHTRIVEKLRRVVYPELRTHPHHGPNIRKLKDFEPETWRHRIGAWRFFYEIDGADRVVSMTAASHRGSAY